MLVIEDFDSRIGNNILYCLSIDLNFNDITELIKDYSIKRNLLEKRTLINMFQDSNSIT